VPPGEELGKIKPSDAVPKEPPKLTVQALLCWSEYYNGKWQPTKTSDVNQPLSLNEFPVTGPGSFDRSILRLGTIEGSFGELLIYISPYSFRYDDPAPIKDIPDYTYVYHAFRLFNTHSLPIVDVVSLWVTDLDVAVIDTSLDVVTTPSNILEISHGKVTAQPVTHHVLRNKIDGYVIVPRHHLANGWEAPFFYWDSRHAFYVTTKKEKVRIQNRTSYYEVPDATMLMSIKPLIIEEYELGAPGPYEVAPTKLNDPAAMKRFVSQDAYIKKAILITSTVHLDGAEIGPAGRVGNPLQEPVKKE
jgi:hypothetical protein